MPAPRPAFPGERHAMPTSLVLERKITLKKTPGLADDRRMFSPSVEKPAPDPRRSRQRTGGGMRDEKSEKKKKKKGKRKWYPKGVAYICA